ncbi:fumarylacetoacetate hydrolase family protein [Helicobacter sp. 11S02596-1]|uniref:fumarylacetoacetate hydrolase family protein n=1 Tax=Helicobacter sp. 11S02596-1 TaxID=1476194 RepID=UPI000BA73171|nr:fumarylacetoacetate hydrolase family protein [Helicobacter sp. 11S02596-1]PAF44710.1 fumarylacetoacetase [Helicobacter sp. 11S02596-1]
MKILTFQQTPNAPSEVGILDTTAQKVIPVEIAGITSMQDLIKYWDKPLKQRLEELISAPKKSFDLCDIKKLAPIPHPAQEVICLGVNYLDHAKESAKFKKEAFDGKRDEAVYFGKRVNTATPDGGVIPSHSHLTQKLDYEVELGVIIAKDAYGVKKCDAFDYVFGYTIINDISARDIQLKHKQWYVGKSLEGSLPMGPWIVTKDEFPCPPTLEISSYVNGELRQKSSTDLMIFDIAYVIEELSAGMVLKAGSILSMGTPSGVGMGFEPPKFLKSGDEVECRIEGIGSLRNTIS